MKELAKWLKELHSGDQVFWTDPDEGKCSGYLKVLEVRTDSGRIEDEESIVILVDDHGCVTEALPGELSSRGFNVIFGVA